MTGPTEETGRDAGATKTGRGGQRYKAANAPPYRRNAAAITPQGRVSLLLPRQPGERLLGSRRVCLY